MSTSGSGLERYVSCRFSSVGPRIWVESADEADAGQAKHAYLERIANGMDAAESLAQAPEECRPACAAIDLDALRGELSLSAEVSLAYNVADDTARVLGQGLGRDYSSVTADEIPMTLDVAGVGPDRVVTADYKTGRGFHVTRADRNWQIRGGALAMARAFDRDAADSQLIHIRDDRLPWRDRATFDALDLAGFASELRVTKARSDADRAAFARGEHVEPTEGPWCRYCPCAWSCPAKVGAIRLALSTTADNLPVTAHEAVNLWERIDTGIKALKKIKSDLIAMAMREPMLRLEADGTATWLGRIDKAGNEQLVPEIAIDEAAAVLEIDGESLAAFQREVAGLDVTKAAIERACKARGVPVATTMKKILARVRARGGAQRVSKESVGIYTEQARTK